MQGEVPKAGQKISGLLEETPGCSHGRSLGVFCFILLCHRDLAAHVIFAQSLVDRPEAGIVKCNQQTGKLCLARRSPSPSSTGRTHTGSGDIKVLGFGHREDALVGSAADSRLQASPALGAGAQAAEDSFRAFSLLGDMSAIS